jgi:hypothetical protein
VFAKEIFAGDESVTGIDFQYQSPAFTSFVAALTRRDIRFWGVYLRRSMEHGITLILWYVLRG